MPWDDRERAFLFHFQRGVLSRKQALACGFTSDALRHRARPGGPWQRLLPGVYLTSTGQPTFMQLATAAQLYAGPSSVITGWTALRHYKVKASETRRIQVLVPASRQCASRAFVAVHRTSRMPNPETQDLAVRFAPVARAVADAVRGLADRSQVRAIVAGAVQKGLCTVADLVAELAEGPVRGSLLLRSVLAEVADGIRSPAEADFRDLIRKSGLPQPVFNPRLMWHGKLLAVPDAWWPEAAVAVEIDSREWHLGPAEWEHTMRRHDRLVAVGIRALHVSPHQVRTEPARILHDIADALRAGQPIPGLVTLPAAA